MFRSVEYITVIFGTEKQVSKFFDILFSRCRSSFFMKYRVESLIMQGATPRNCYRCDMVARCCYQSLMGVICIRKTLWYISAPRNLQRFCRNADGGATWRLYYEHCFRGIHSKQVTVENFHESKTHQWLSCFWARR